ncbi:MAG TPA: GNAT family N-acetyltransferase [Casimicrobiaceae bacterium]|jgi:predicted acetyltransferase
MIAEVAVAADPASIGAMMTPYLRELTPDGPAVYPRLALYWEDRQRVPYVIRLADADVGFALIREHMDARLHEMAEFYVGPAWRRRGIGRQAVQDLFARHRGFWHLQILEDNWAARAFWRSVVPPPVEETHHVAANGRHFLVMQFCAACAADAHAR